MRIISGKHRGRAIATLEGKTMRPTTSMVREAMFNILAHRRFGEREGSIFEDAVVADLFCGSGALGLEALSRGAARAIFVDVEPKHLEVARYNAKHMGEFSNCQFFRNDSSQPPKLTTPCDLIFIDPPYKSGLMVKTLQHLSASGWLIKGTVLVLELSKQEDIVLPEGFVEVVTRRYGITKIMVVEVA